MTDTNDIALLKLSNNMDVMGKIVVGGAKTLVLNKPRQIVYQQIGNDTRIGFSAFMPANVDDNVPINRQHIMVESRAADNITEAYKQAVSPIQLATTIPKGLQ
jgi:hypothetical protein